MDERKENKNGEQLHNSQKETDNEDYSFLRETIKGKPMDKRKICFKVLGLIGGAILFGIVAAVVFVRVVPMVENYSKKPEQVDIPTDDPEETVTPEPEPTATEVTPTPEEEEPADILGTYRDAYIAMQAIAEEPSHAMTTVTGVASDEDWFNEVNESKSQAAGVIVANNGQDLLILTQYGAIQEVDRILVAFWDGTEVDAQYQKYDSNTGLAIVRVPNGSLPAETMDEVVVAELGNSYGVTQGEPVIAIGSPMGYSKSIVYGQVTSIDNKISTIDTEYNLITTNVMGSADGSGVLIDLDGKIVGIIAQKYASENNKNIIMGLSISQLKNLIETLSNNGELVYMGIQGQDVTETISSQSGMPKGVYVNVAQPDSPALQAGIQNADIITKINGEDVETLRSLHDKLCKCAAGTVLKVTVMRKGAEGYVEFEFQVTLQALS